MRASRLTRPSLGIIATLAVIAALAPAAAAQHQTSRADGAPIDFNDWTTQQDFESGELAGLRAGPDGLRIDQPIGTTRRAKPDGTAAEYEYGQWTSPSYRHGFDATELIASWNADTPAGTWLKVEMSGSTDSDERTGWYTLGEWAYGDGDINRTTVPDQADKHGRVNVDTFATADGVGLRTYRLRATLYRVKGQQVSPTVPMVGAMTSAIPDRFEVPASVPGVAAGKELDVPRYSQNVHKGHYPEFGGGGEVWCSPTSTAMVTEYWGKGPSEQDLSWIPADHPDRSVDHAARHTFDYDYQGAGNWPFNTAYASHWGLRGHITRLQSLNELESYIAKGIPVITSQSFLAEELDGAGYGTEGHIMVVVGFTKDGDVIANDPASSSNEQVRHVYKRAQFEKIWLRTKRHDENGAVASGPGGIAYIISPR